MEVLTAIGLAGNIVQFVSFASALISKSHEIHSSATGCTDRVTYLDTIYGKLRDFSSELQSGQFNGRSSSQRLVAHDTRIKELSNSCRIDCDKLLEIVRKLQSDNGSKGPWRSFRKALKIHWMKEYIDDLERRLSGTQATLTLAICAVTRYYPR